MRFPYTRLVNDRRSLNLLFLIVTSAGSVCAQEQISAPKPSQRDTAPVTTPAPTFDKLLAADSYKMYGEVRNLGELMSTVGAAEIVDPIMKLADPPKEFRSIVKFLKANSEALASSRLLFATWPARKNVPNVFVAIEFGTSEEAAKFAPKLETFLPAVFPATPVQTNEKQNESKPGEAPSQPASAKVNDAPAGNNPSTPSAERLPFVIERSGNLVFISDQAFKMERIHPPASKSLTEDQNFRVARDRFASEPVFVYFNIALEDRTKQQSQTRAPVKPEVQPAEQEDTAVRRDNETQANASEANQNSSDPSVRTEQRAVLIAPARVEPTPDAAQQAQRVATNQAGRMLDFLGMGEAQSPEAVGLALVLDNNEYVIRAIVIDAPDAKHLPIPFIPQLVSGPATGTSVTSVLPDDTEVFVSASVDAARTYEGMRKQAEIRAKAQEALSRRSKPQGTGTTERALDPFAEFEQKSGIKIKDELLPVMGNEIAIAGSLSSLQGAGGINLGVRVQPTGATSATDKDAAKNAATFPIIAIAIKDRDAASRLMPRVLTGFGIGEVNLIAQKERRGDVEIVSYAGMFAYAFVGDFLVMSDAATVKRVADANSNHQTLSSNSTYRNSSRWQPRDSLGQIYISPALMEAYQAEVNKQAATMDPAMRDFLLRLSPEASAITYALSNDGLGTVHEVHLPKNLIISMVAGMSSASKNPPPEMNEALAMGITQMIAAAEMSYKTNAGNGGYGSLDQLAAQKLVNREMLERYGYKFEVTASENLFEVVATPLEYGKTGKRSFFIDQSNVLRGGDHGGGPATIADNPIQ